MARLPAGISMLRFGLGLQPAHNYTFAGLLALSALTFAAVLQMLTAVFGTAGRLVGIVLLLLAMVLTTLAARRARQWTPSRLWPQLGLIVR